MKIIIQVLKKIWSPCKYNIDINFFTHISNSFIQLMWSLLVYQTIHYRLMVVIRLKYFYQRWKNKCVVTFRLNKKKYVDSYVDNINFSSGIVKFLLKKIKRSLRSNLAFVNFFFCERCFGLFNNFRNYSEQ